MNSLVSIIIPIYNTERYLDRCINSAIKQTYDNLEIVLVDDGSEDNSLRVCKKYAKGDKRIRVIHKKNGGLSDARNVGLSRCSGDFVFFLDSDDWIPDDAIEELYSIMGDNITISVGSIKGVSHYSDQINGDARQKLAFFEKNEALEALMYMRISNSASGKLYRRNLFKKINYPVGRYYEDLATTYKLFDSSNKIAVTDKTVYYYYQNKNGIMHNSFSETRLDAYEFAMEELRFVSEKYPTIIRSAVFRLFFECALILDSMPAKCAQKKEIKATIKKYRKTVLDDKKVSKKQKILCYSTLFGQPGVKAAFRLRKILFNK